MKSRTWMWTLLVWLFAALAMPVQARVVYTPVNVTLPANGFYPIDLNHDGIIDFTFQTSLTTTLCYPLPSLRFILNVQPGPAGGIVGGSWASALQSGVLIDIRQSFYISDALLYDVQQESRCTSGHSYGYWVAVQHGYLGFEFQINGQPHYGWAELSTNVTTGGVDTLYGFAYETMSFKGILIGQTMDSPDEQATDSGSAESKGPGPTAPVAPFANAPQPQPPEAQIITFDAPGAGTGPGQGTFITNPGTINPDGRITGYYCDAINCHGFLRAPDGVFTTFDAPDDLGGTYPSGINPEGAITGSYADSSSVDHGFLRTRDGTITTIDPAGSIATSANAINPEEAITGSYFDTGSGCHGFLRARDGTFTIFDAPGAGTGSGQGTFGFAINPAGAIEATYVDASNVYHGYLRARDGTFATFDAPGAGAGPGQGTIPFGLNPAGAIAGYYVDLSGVIHGFLRARDGTITTFDAPGAGTGPGQGTIAQSINPAGMIAGYYVDASNVAHGFLRKKQCGRDGHERDCEGGE